MLNKKAKLNRELARFKKELGGFTWIHCPEIVALYMGSEFENYILNQQFKQQKEKFASCILASDFVSLLQYTARPYRLQMLVDYLSDIPQEQLFECVEFVWVDSENPMVNAEIWRTIFTLPQLKEDFEKTKKNLPESFFIYRGTKDRFDNGISWTISEQQARWFADRYFTKKNINDGIVLKKSVKRSEIAMFTNRRGESEVIYLGGSNDKIEKELFGEEK